MICQPVTIMIAGDENTVFALRRREFVERIDISREELLVDFASKLAEIRKRLGISQSELGTKVGLSRQSISSIERGNVPMTWNTFLAICLVIMVNNSQLFSEMETDERYSAVIESLKIGN